MVLYGSDLARIQAEAFGEFAERASPGLVAILRAARIPVRRVYDVGCGAGVTTRALSVAGFEPIGVEPSPALLAIARAAAPGASFIGASAYEVALAPCDAILAVGEVLTYHTPDDDGPGRLRAFFARAGAAIAPGGLLVFDLIDAEGPSLDAKSWKLLGDWALLWETREDRAHARLTRSVEMFMRETDGRYRRASESHAVCLFRAADVLRWLDEAGFDATASHTCGEAALAPRRVAFIATRR